MKITPRMMGLLVKRLPIAIGIFAAAFLRASHPIAAASFALATLLFVGWMAWIQWSYERVPTAALRGDVPALAAIVEGCGQRRTRSEIRVLATIALIWNGGLDKLAALGLPSCDCGAEDCYPEARARAFAQTMRVLELMEQGQPRDALKVLKEGGAIFLPKFPAPLVNPQEDARWSDLRVLLGSFVVTFQRPEDSTPRPPEKRDAWFETMTRLALRPELRAAAELTMAMELVREDKIDEAVARLRALPTWPATSFLTMARQQLERAIATLSE